MHSKTITVSIAVPPSIVYSFAGNPANLPSWVHSFCNSVARVNDEWRVESPHGPVVIAFVENNKFGVLDHTVTFPSGLSLTNPMRVISNGKGSELLFTLYQHEGMSDKQFSDDAELVRSDLQTLRGILESSCI